MKNSIFSRIRSIQQKPGSARRGIALGLSVLMLATLGCGLSIGATGSATSVPATVLVTVLVPVTAETSTPAADAPADTPAPQNTLVPTFTAIPPTNQPTATSGPQCIIQQRVNLRNGPGTAFTPPLRALEAGAVVIPQGFNPNGIPDSAWVQVFDPSQNDTGWVIASPASIQCTVDVTKLPVVAAGVPPPPVPPRLSNSDVDGSPDTLVGKVIVQSAIGMEFQVHVPDHKENGKFIKNVTFQVSKKGGGQVYQHTENSAPYCLFGGSSGCAPWPVKNFVFYWGSGGPRVEPGVYHVNITAETNDKYTDHLQGVWFFDLTVK